ncbi:MAG: hypothetical protein QXY49_00135 [Thermofilaceae archaeon]
MRVYPYTLTWLFWAKGSYRPPWLWSLVEVLKRLAPSEREKLIVTGWDTPRLQNSTPIIAAHAQALLNDCSKDGKSYAIKAT